jgi:aspartyl-tRNA(Asn)/glutamyl-tRNA(Gln) amidotransferase subunit B
MEDAKLGKMEDTDALAEVVDRVLANFPQDVERYKAGEVQLIKFFLGMIMKETDGQADPGAAKNILASKLQ